MSERASVAPVPRGLRVVSLVLVALVLAFAGRAAADEGAGDGLYGRFDGDVWLAAGLGAGAVVDHGAARDGSTLELRARFLDSVGPFAFAQAEGLAGSGAAWSIGGGLELRPLFLARFLTNNSLGREWLDVLIDSLGLELGVVALSPAQRAQAALVFGGGLEVPLVLGAVRISLRVGVRWMHAEHLRTGVLNDVSVLGGLVVSAPVDVGLASREGPRALLE